jgi:hypothetical protein
MWIDLNWGVSPNNRGYILKVMYKQKEKLYVYVLNRHGKPLMPCSPRKARLLLKQHKAKVIRRTPFTIQLLYGSGSATQPITLGVDSGYEHVGLSAVTEKQEVFSAEVLLRKDVSKLMTERRMYRRARRARKTRYRKCRFLNRIAKFKQNPLAPSIQHKLDSHVRIIQKVMSILPVTKIIVETANFDIQRIKNPEIKGKAYQLGEQLGFNNVKAYVLHRDNYACQSCNGSSKEPRLHVHHLTQRSQGGSDRPDNLIMLCKGCHDKHHAGLIELKVKVSRGFKPETFMSTVRQKLLIRLQSIYKGVEETFGYVTKTVRQQLGLDKSHQNDAFVISNGINQIRGAQFIAEPKRRNNRSLQLNRKGFRPSIRRQRYCYRPKDDVLIRGVWYLVKGVHSYGKQTKVLNKLGEVKSVATKFIEQHCYQNGWRFSYVR